MGYFGEDNNSLHSEIEWFMAGKIMKRKASNRFHIRCILGVLAVAFAVAPGSAQDAETVLVDLPSAGRLAAVSAELASVLESQGMRALQPVAGQLPEPLPSRVVTDDDSIRDPQRQQVLRRFVKEGGGLVLIIDRSRRHIEQANRFVEPLGLQIIPVASSLKPVEFYATPLAADLDMPDVGSLRMTITGQVTVPIARQGENLVCTATSWGQGGLILLPAPLALAGADGEAGWSGLELLTRCVRWSAQLPELASYAPAVQVGGTGEAELEVPTGRTNLPRESRDFAGAILYDCQATQDQWPQITAVVAQALQESGLPIRALAVSGRPDPLVEALYSWPELVVLGTWRQYSVAEQAAVYQYVAAGGSLLVLTYAHTDRQMRLVYLSEVLSHFGVLCSLGRPGGSAQATGGPVRQLGDIPGGVRVLGQRVKPLITVGSQPHLAAGYMEFESGRLVVMDARPLLKNAGYRLQLSQWVLPWLLPAA